MEFTRIGNVKVRGSAQGLEFEIPHGMSGPVFDKWKWAFRKELLELSNRIEVDHEDTAVRGMYSEEDAEQIRGAEARIEARNTEEEQEVQMSESDILACSHINTKKYSQRLRDVNAHILILKKHKAALVGWNVCDLIRLGVTQDPIYRNIETIRRDVRLETFKKKRSRIEQILAYRSLRND